MQLTRLPAIDHQVTGAQLRAFDVDAAAQQFAHGTGKFEAGAAECLLHQRRTVDRISVIAAEFVIGTEHRQRLAQYYVADEAGAGAVGEFQMQLGYRDHRRDRWIGSRLQALAESQPDRKSTRLNSSH